MIRQMREEDRATLHRFLSQLSAHELTIEPNRTAEFEPNARQFDAVEDEIKATGGFILVAEVNSHPIGYLSVIYRTSGAFIQERLRRYAHVEDFFVSVEHRGTGTGRALFTAAEARVRRDGVTSIRLSAVTGNTMAHHAYQAWGFKPYATEYIVRLE
jgi:GNAT superfamily N-acetyltransferase